MGSDCAATGGEHGDRPSYYKIIGILLAVSSGLFIGTSFVLKKTGLLRANVKYSEEAGEGYGYLKNAFWWSGMILMIIGEICNFVAYAFVDAVLVTPLGALSVVITTILSAIFLKERLSFVGKVGCFNCIVGSVVIVLNAPEQSSAATIQQMQCFVISPGFLSYAGVILVGCAVIALWAGPRYGKKSMLVYLSVCSLIGGLSVVATQGLGAAIVSEANGSSKGQFKHWFLYVLLVFVIATLLTEIVFLNKALNIFNAALVTPTYYVYFTSATIVSSAILFQGFKGSPVQITTIVMGFLQICAGVVLLQLSKSSKDVPDAAVFQGDLDQVRTVAEQEEHESEPKADAIRGTAALIRSFSKVRQQNEKLEARRVQSEKLEPIGENEQVEWDGIRRRKTVLTPGQSPLPRSKTLHPPLGLTRFPDGDEDPAVRYSHPHAGLFPAIRSKAHTVFHPKPSEDNKLRSVSGRSSSYGSEISSTLDGSKMQLNEMSATRVPSGKSEDSDVATAPLVSGMPPALRSQYGEDTSYRSPRAPSIQFAEKSDGRSQSKGPTPPPHYIRQFSFQDLLPKSGSKSKATVQAPPRGDSLGVSQYQGSLHRPSTSSSAGSGRRSFFSLGRKGTGGSGGVVTEEERLGLVVAGRDSSSVQRGAGRSGGAGNAGDLGSQKIREERDEESDTGSVRQGYNDDFDDDERDDFYDGKGGSPSGSNDSSDGYEKIGRRDFGGYGGGGGAGAGGGRAKRAPAFM